ncbi:MAG: hypothetical protein SP1CHLAM54_00610 [Chlamydiia bacterium]|nr:hypothetical protein [Chlamydiia bacterium]MCH9614983.1 hypothetical protein [Chlamydiia bacterium]MCH9629967.1 hypothetical protein [Chlamydiia bacterium]
MDPLQAISLNIPEPEKTPELEEVQVGALIVDNQPLEVTQLTPTQTAIYNILNNLNTL